MKQNRLFALLLSAAAAPTSVAGQITSDLTSFRPTAWSQAKAGMFWTDNLPASLIFADDQRPRRPDTDGWQVLGLSILSFAAAGAFQAVVLNNVFGSDTSVPLWAVSGAVLGAGVALVICEINGCTWERRPLPRRW